MDGAIAALAGRQHGVVTRAQLLATGVGRRAIDGRIERGLLHPLHRGVFAVGHRSLRREAWWMAAVLAAGSGAALSHRSAAALWRIRDTSRGRIDVSAPRHRRSTARLERHRVELPADEVTIEDGIPVTTPARTLFDLAAVVPYGQLEAAFNEAESCGSRARRPSRRCSSVTRGGAGPARSERCSSAMAGTARRERGPSSSAGCSPSSTPMACPARG